MIRVLELFSGYGGASFGLKKAGLPYVVVGFSDIDKYANQCFRQNHKGKELGDVTQINPDDLEDFDLLTGGFPCQSFSIAGKREGFEAEDKGNLFFEIIRIAKAKKPKYMLLENVKGILSHDNGNTHFRVLQELKKLGYGVAWKCLNSKQYGIPQNRERVWYVCKLGGWDFMEFMFPQKEELKIFIKDILEEQVDKKYYLSEEAIAKIKRSMCGENNIIDKDSKSSGCIISSYYKIPRDGVYVADLYNKTTHKQVCPTITLPHHNTLRLCEGQVEIADFRNDEGLRIRQDGCSPCLATRKHSSTDLSTSPPLVKVHCLQQRSADRPSIKENKNAGGTGHIFRDDGTTYCLDTANTQAIEMKDVWRKLTPCECFRLMGFLDDDINLDGLSDTQKYKLAGNGWDVNLASKILKRMFKDVS